MINPQSFPVSLPIVGNLETLPISGKPAGNFQETLSIKALANRVLQGNRKETSGKCSVSAIDLATMKAEYACLSEWLASRDMIDRKTAAYRDIILQINALDELMLAGKFEAFEIQARHVRYAYHIAETTNLNNPKEGHNHVQNNKAADR